MLSYTGEGFVPAVIDPRPLEDVSAITFLGAQVAEKYPVVKTWQVPPPATVADDKLVTQKGPYVPLRSLERANAFPVLQGYKNTVVLAITSISRSPSVASLGLTGYTRRGAVPTSAARRNRGLYRTVGPASGTVDFYDLFSPTSAAQGQRPPKSLMTGRHLRRSAELTLKFDYALRPDRTPANAITSTRSPADHGESGSLQRVRARSRGRRRKA